jgi:hypothetical protein
MTPTGKNISHVRHDSQTCPRCEPVAPDGWRRHWKEEPQHRAWHVISDSPDLLARLPKSAHFVTILTYRPGADDLPSSYRGPLYFEGDADDPREVLRDIRRGIEVLCLEYECADAVRLWLSGGRSLHATIPAQAIGAEAGHPLLPEIYARLIHRLFPKTMAPTLDRSIYNRGKGRMWRLPNRRRSDTGCYKVPISLAELLYQPYATLEALTHHPRRGTFWTAETELNPCPGLVQRYHEVRRRVEAEAARDHRRRSDDLAAGTYQDSAGLLFHLFQGRAWIEQELSAGKWSVICPWSREHTKGTPGDRSTVIFASQGGVGWFHCSHAHCQGKGLRQLLPLFTEAERFQAERARGIRTIAADAIMAQGLRTIDAGEVPPWRK